jgi:hypothetical protein
MRHGHNHGQANAHSIRSQEVRPNEAHRFLKVVHRYQGKDRTIRQDSIRSRQDKDHIRRNQDSIRCRQKASRKDIIHPKEAQAKTTRRCHLDTIRRKEANLIGISPQNAAIQSHVDCLGNGVVRRLRSCQ